MCGSIAIKEKAFHVDAAEQAYTQVSRKVFEYEYEYNVRTCVSANIEASKAAPHTCESSNFAVNNSISKDMFCILCLNE